MLWHRLIRDRAEMMCQGLTQPPVRLHLAAKFWIGGDSTLHMRMDLRVQLSVRKGHQHLVSDLHAATPSPTSSALSPRTSRDGNVHLGMSNMSTHSRQETTLSRQTTKTTHSHSAS